MSIEDEEDEVPLASSHKKKKPKEEGKENLCSSYTPRSFDLKQRRRWLLQKLPKDILR